MHAGSFKGFAFLVGAGVLALLVVPIVAKFIPTSTSAVTATT